MAGKKILLIVIVLLGAYFLFNSSRKNPGIVPMSQLDKEEVQILHDEVSRAIEEKGFDEAYHLYLQKYPGGSMMGHAADHFFGEYLYGEYGLPGISRCQNKYTFGCEHAVIFGEIGKKGNSAVEQIVTICKKLDQERNNACRHALGHTLIELHGEARLFDVLKTCEKIDGVIKPHGCVGGAIMQYFFPALYSPLSDLPQFLAFDSGSPYGPCPLAQEDFGEVCNYSLPEWWSKVFNRDYGKISELCSKILKEIHKRACFEGMGGDIVYNSNYNINLTKSACETAPKIQDKEACLAGAAAHFLTNRKIEEWDLNLICGESEDCQKQANLALDKYY